MVRRLRSPLLAAVPAAVVFASSAAPASAAYRTFRSPSGRLGCAFYSDAETPRQVRCEWKGGGDHAVVLNENGKGRRIHITDTVFDPKAKALAYGRTSTFGDLRCTSRTAGIACRSTRNAHGFTVSTAKQRVF
jgi:hypothetical protein